VFEEIELAEEVETGRGVRIVLVRGGFLWLRLDVELALEPDSMLVIDRHVQEPGEVATFPLHVGVDERPVAFAPSPEDVALAAEPMGRFQRRLDLRRGVAVDVDQRARARAGGVPLVGEETGGAPEQSTSARFHLGFDHVDHRVEVAFAFGDVVTLGGDVPIVKAEEVDVDLLQEFEEDPDTSAGVFDGGRPVVPGSLGGAEPERIRERIPHGVPVAARESKMIAHRFSGDHSIGVVASEPERSVAVESLIGDHLDVGECFGRHGPRLFGFPAKVDPQSIGPARRVVGSVQMGGRS